MYSVDFRIDGCWTMYATGLTANESAQIGRMLSDLGYEVRLQESRTPELVKEVDFLLGAVQVLEQEQLTSRDTEVSERLMRMQEELIQAIRRERKGEIRWIPLAPEDVPAALD